MDEHFLPDRGGRTEAGKSWIGRSGKGNPGPGRSRTGAGKFRNDPGERFAGDSAHLKNPERMKPKGSGIHQKFSFTVGRQDEGNTSRGREMPGGKGEDFPVGKRSGVPCRASAWVRSLE